MAERERRSISIYDIARDLGISSGTVSRAFNDHPEVSRKTRERILAKARELGYTPSPLARALARNVTAAIGVVIPTISDPFFLDFAQGVQQAAIDSGVAVMMSFTDHGTETLFSAVRSFEQFRVAGILLFGGSGDHDAALAETVQTPLVVALRRSPNDVFPAVYVDHEQGAFDMVSLLAAKGHQRIAYVSLPMATQASHERIAGYRRALRKLGRLRKAVEIVAEGNGFGDGVAVTERLLAHPAAREIDAIFYASDALATGGLHALANAGRRIPESVAVAGFGDIISSAVTVPSLTTVHVPMREVGARSMELLLGAIKDPDAPREGLLLPSAIVERQSA